MYRMIQMLYFILFMMVTKIQIIMNIQLLFTAGQTSTYIAIDAMIDKIIIWKGVFGHLSQTPLRSPESLPDLTSLVY